MLKLKNKNCHNTLRYFHEVRCIKINPFLCVCYSYVETIFKLKLNTFVTKYKDTLNFNFIYTINGIDICVVNVILLCVTTSMVCVQDEVMYVNVLKVQYS